RQALAETLWIEVDGTDLLARAALDARVGDLDELHADRRLRRDVAVVESDRTDAQAEEEPPQERVEEAPEGQREEDADHDGARRPRAVDEDARIDPPEHHGRDERSDEPGAEQMLQDPPAALLLAVDVFPEPARVAHGT